MPTRSRTHPTRQATTASPKPSAPTAEAERGAFPVALVLGLVSVPLGIVLTDVGLMLVTAGVPADDVPYLIKFRLDHPLARLDKSPKTTRHKFNFS